MHRRRQLWAVRAPLRAGTKIPTTGNRAARVGQEAACSEKQRSPRKPTQETSRAQTSSLRRGHCSSVCSAKAQGGKWPSQRGILTGTAWLGTAPRRLLTTPRSHKPPHIAQFGATWLCSKQNTSPTTAWCEQNPRFLRFRRHFWLKALRRWLLGLSLLT